MYILYQFLLTFLFVGLLPFLLLFVLITGKHREGLSQRFGFYRRLSPKSGRIRVWLHAASVGEVQAAGVLVRKLRTELPSADFFITTMTLHGRKFAEDQHGGEAVCTLAPLDIPGIVDLAIHTISPDIYVCLETELWPVLLRRLNRQKIPAILVNGRMSSNTSAFYKKHSWLFRRVVENFDLLCLISESDRYRYSALGTSDLEMHVTGNLKYDRALPDQPASTRNHYLKMLQIPASEEVLITGSTHSGEEELLIPVYQALSKEKPLYWLVAPRHLDRLASLTELFAANNIGFDTLSNLVNGGVREHRVVLVDSFGELADLYSIGTYIFCGGSLVERRGHNILEAAIWNKAVLHGPSMDDFQDAVELLKSAGGSFQVEKGEELMEHICSFRSHPQEYALACTRAGEVARSQQGAAQKQAEQIVSLLSSSSS